MGKPLKFKQLLAPVRQALERLPEHRTGQNIQYSLTEAGLRVLSRYFTCSRPRS